MEINVLPATGGGCFMPYAQGVNNFFLHPKTGTGVQALTGGKLEPVGKNNIFACDLSHCEVYDDSACTTPTATTTI